MTVVWNGYLVSMLNRLASLTVRCGKKPVAKRCGRTRTVGGQPQEVAGFAEEQERRDALMEATDAEQRAGAR